MDTNTAGDDRYARAVKALGWTKGRITVDEGATVVEGGQVRWGGVRG
ncbi:hypothetical protein [Pimelobacter simplex]|nr:hypothetical protein [Pimelobacter simplex]UUW92988.1 hypothetical protein M0M43_30610 [Pimelobacter simplex]UUW99021.1 hypothetical protein M0M48_30630 [Pimelobacter simplex]